MESNWLNKITREDYLHAEGAQMMIRRLCEWFANGFDEFPYTDGYRTKMVKSTPMQRLDTIRRFTAGVIKADIFLKGDNLVVCPVWCEKKGKPAIERIDIITKEEYNARKQQRQMA